MPGRTVSPRTSSLGTAPRSPTPRLVATFIAIIAEVERAGFEIGGQTYTRPPRGVTADGPATERLLRHSALYAHGELPAPTATTPGFLSEALRRWRTFAPVHRWLHDHVQRQA